MRSTAIVLLALLIAVLGCRIGERSSKPETAGETPNETPTAGSADISGKKKDDEKTPEKTENSGKEFRKSEFSKETAARQFEFAGNIVAGAHWFDSLGENTIIVTESKIVRGTDDTEHLIFGYHYVIYSDGSTDLLWKIQDNARNYCDQGKGLTSPIDVRDLDGDGVGESMFVYNIAGGCDVSPIPYKLMMHSGAKKLAIRGTNSVEVPDYRERGAKNFDGFDSEPRVFRDAASEFWDRYVAPLR